MLVSRIDEDNYLVKIPFSEDNDFCFEDNEEILSFFKIIFGKLISKYKISGDIVVNFYLDYDYGIVLEIYNSCSYGEDINTKIIFHLNCKFLVEVDYFKYRGKNIPLYYFEDKFYKEIDNKNIDDGEIIYDNEEIIDKGIILYT